MLHTNSPDAILKADRCVRSNEHCDCACAARRSGWAATIHGNIASDDNSHSTIPSGRLDPVESVKECAGATVTSVDGV